MQEVFELFAGDQAPQHAQANLVPMLGERYHTRALKADEARRAALEDSEVLRSLAKLAQEIEIVKIHERLDEIDLG